MVLPASAEEGTEDYYYFPEDCNKYYNEIIDYYSNWKYPESLTEHQIEELESIKSENISSEQSFKLVTHIFKDMSIARFSKDCGAVNRQFFVSENRLCRSSIVRSELKTFLTKNKVKEYFQRDNDYCDSALERGDAKLFFNLFEDFATGYFIQRDYKKAIEYLEILVSKNPDEEDTFFFATPLYRYGGYGLEKDEKKAFEILSSIADKEQSNKIPCELSLYYRNGIGTEVDIEKADEWLSVYKKHNPDKECEFADFGFMTGE